VTRGVGVEVRVRVEHDDRGPAAELEAPTPVDDSAWATRHPAVFAAFSRERIWIVSFQGRRVPY
jgi:hypothetical protein